MADMDDTPTVEEYADVLENVADKRKIAAALREMVENTVFTHADLVIMAVNVLTFCIARTPEEFGGHIMQDRILPAFLECVARDMTRRGINRVIN